MSPARPSSPARQRAFRTESRAGRATVGRNRSTQQQQSAPEPQNAQPAAARDPVAQLKELAELKNQGILTDAEFEAQKAKILAS